MYIANHKSPISPNSPISPDGELEELRKILSYKYKSQPLKSKAIKA